MADDLIVKESSIHGTGCYAARAFKKGEIIGEYTGERISEEEADECYGDDPEEKETYLFLLENRTVIDATPDPNPIKYINHCCDPNCESFEKDDRIFIKAIRDIAEGEELAYDYSLQVDDEDDDPCHCRCGAPNCRGTMREEEE